MSKKFFFILSLFIVLLCCFSTVSASKDVNNNILHSNDVSVDNVLSEVDLSHKSISTVNNNEYKVNAEDKLQDSASNIYYVSNSSLGGDGSLENPFNWTTAYSTANDGDEIKFIAGTYTDSLNIDKNLTLSGLGNVILSLGDITLNSNKKVLISNFNIDNMAINNNGHLTLSKILMVGNKGITNNAIGELYIINSSFSNYNAENTYIENNGYLNIMSTTFNNITNSKYSGGVIYNSGRNSIVIINNTHFIKNSATSGSAIYNDNGDSVKVYNSIFVNNTEDPEDGVIRGSGIDVYNSVFYNINANIHIVDEGNGVAGISGTFFDDYIETSSQKIGILLKNNNDGSEKSKDYNIQPNVAFDVSINNLSAGFYTGFLVDQNGNKFAFSNAQTIGVIYVSPSGSGDGRSRDNPTTLVNAFNNVSQGGIIYLLPGDYSYSNNTNVNGNDFRVYAENGVNLDATGKTWSLSSKNVYLENINFTNVQILTSTNTNNLTIINCGFYNCENIAIKSYAKYNNIDYCIFSDNKQLSINLPSTTSYKLDVNNSKFLNNKNICIELEGALNNYHGGHDFDLSISNSYFINNTGTSTIYSDYLANFDLKNCNFINNTGINSGVFFGKTTTQYLRVYSSNFINNTATYDNENNVAGVFKLGSNQWWNRLIVYDSKFESNYAPYGGVVRIDSGGVRFYNSTFIDNHAKSGGVMRATMTMGSVDIYDCNFYKNYATDNSGVISVIKNGYVNIYNTTFDSNYAGNDAGVIGITGNGNLYCNSSKFINNSAKRGGAIGIDIGNIRIFNSEFINNSATQYVGAIAANGENDIIVEKSKFIGNTAPFAGAIGGQSGDISIFDSYFESNNATHGGAIGSQGGTIKVNESEFKYNKASNASGAVYNNGGEINIYNSKFSNNTATYQAGVIGITGVSSFVRIYNSTFINNSAKRAGVIGVENSTLNIFNSNFTLNFGDQAGVVAVTGTGAIYIYKSGFYNNNATLAGAVASDGGSIVIDESIFEENNAVHGGAIGSDNGTIEIYDSIFNKNIATIASGAIYNAGGRILVNNSRFTENKAASEVVSNVAVVFAATVIVFAIVSVLPFVSIVISLLIVAVESSS